MAGIGASFVALIMFLFIGTFCFFLGRPSEIYLVTVMTIDHHDDNITLSQFVQYNHDEARKIFSREVERIHNIYSLKEFYPEGYKVYANEQEDKTKKELIAGNELEKKYVIAGIDENGNEIQTNILLFLKQI